MRLDRLKPIILGLADISVVGWRAKERIDKQFAEANQTSTSGAAVHLSDCFQKDGVADHQQGIFRAEFLPNLVTQIFVLGQFGNSGT